MRNNCVREDIREQNCSMENKSVLFRKPSAVCHDSVSHTIIKVYTVFFGTHQRIYLIFQLQKQSLSKPKQSLKNQFSNVLTHSQKAEQK